MMLRRLEGEKWPHGLSWMFSVFPDRKWYFGLFLRLGNRLWGFRYRSFSFTVFFNGELLS